MSTWYAQDAALLPALAGASWSQRAAAARSAGFDGLGLTLASPEDVSGVQPVLAALHEQSMELSAVRLTWDIRSESVANLWPALADRLAGGRTLLALRLISSSAHDRPSSPRGDAAAAQAIQDWAGQLAAAGVRLALQPQPGAWLARPEDAVRLVLRINRPNIGLALDLTPLTAPDQPPMEPRLYLVRNRLWDVTLSAAELDPAALSTRIGPAWAVLARLGYGGSVGYTGPPPAHCAAVVHHLQTVRDALRTRGIR